MKYALCALSLIIFTTLLSGCGASPKNLDDFEIGAEKRIVLKKPGNLSETPLEKAMTVCEANGFKVTVNQQYDKVETLCVFDDGTGCDVLAFQSGKCSKLAGASPLSAVENQDGIASLRYCKANNQPVCGKNGKTYVNECTAQVDGTEVESEGPCPGSSEDAAGVSQTGGFFSLISSKVSQQVSRTTRTVESSGTDDSDDASSGSTSQKSQTSSSNASNVTYQTKKTQSGQSTTKIKTVIKTSDTPVALDDWFDVLVDMAASESKSAPSTFVEICEYSKNVVLFYKSDGASNGFDTLYDIDGAAVCFPKHDINGLCPDFFNVNDRQPNCKKVWPV
ncbi:hypothetical protein H6758_03295 [Candidatus Nomurabacteria bacterium]|nr:hypothetical protein [Candidatus Nomurabacteria bacterium]